MNNEKIARQLIGLAKSITGKEDGRKKEAGGYGWDNKDIKHLAKELDGLHKQIDWDDADDDDKAVIEVVIKYHDDGKKIDYKIIDLGFSHR